MVRETSMEAYLQIIANGVLDGLRLKVFHFVYFNGPCTSRQILEALHGEGHSGQFTGRLSELVRMGALREVDTVICEVTGHRVLRWEATGNPARKLLGKKKSAIYKFASACAIAEVFSEHERVYEVVLRVAPHTKLYVRSHSEASAKSLVCHAKIADVAVTKSLFD